MLPPTPIPGPKKLLMQRLRICTFCPLLVDIGLMTRPSPIAWLVPSSSISGPSGLVSPVKAVCVLPSMTVPLLRMSQRGESGWIVNQPLAGTGAGMLNTIVQPELTLEKRIASRSDPAPASFVLVTKSSQRTSAGGENSDVPSLTVPHV